MKKRKYISFVLICLLMMSFAVPSFSAGESVKMILEGSDISDGKATLTLNVVVNGAYNTTTVVFALSLPPGSEVDWERAGWQRCEGWQEGNNSWQNYVFNSEDQESFYSAVAQGGENYFQFHITPANNQSLISDFSIPLKNVTEGTVSIHESSGGEPYAIIKKLSQTKPKVTLTTLTSDSVTSVELHSSGQDPTPSPIPEESITFKPAGATVTGTVTDGTATLKVSDINKACVVAYTTNGTDYERASATAVGDGSYNFEVPYTEGMQFVVAVKGDANGDGNINANDLSLFVNASNGDYSAIDYAQALTLLIGDTDNNEVLNANDLSMLVNASNGIALSW